MRSLRVLVTELLPQYAHNSVTNESLVCHPYFLVYQPPLFPEQEEEITVPLVQVHGCCLTPPFIFQD